MGTLFSKEENEGKLEGTFKTTPNNDTTDNISQAKESNFNKDFKTDEKHESLKNEVNQQDKKEQPSNNLKREENDKISKLTNSLKNVQIEQNPTLLDSTIPQQKANSKRKKPICLMVIPKNGLQFTANNANNDKKSPEEPRKNLTTRECSCSCDHQPDYLSECTCLCCANNYSNTQTGWNNIEPNFYPQNFVGGSFQQPSSSHDVSYIHIEAVQQNNFQHNTYNYGFNDPVPLTDPVQTSQEFNFEQPTRYNSYPNYLQTSGPVSHQQYYQQVENCSHIETITNHSFPCNHPSTSAVRLQSNRKGRPRLAHPSTRSINARKYQERDKKLINLSKKIIANLNNFSESDRHLIERLMIEVERDATNGNQGQERHE